MIRLFSKKNKQTTIAELEEYYANQNQRKGSSLNAWLMALLSLLMTIAIIVGLFFGGRWLYRTLEGNDNSNTGVSSSDTAGNVNLPSFDGGSFNGAESNNSTSPTGDSGNATGNTNAESTDISGGVVSDEAVSTNDSNEDRVLAGDGTEEIPNTGSSELIAIVVIALLSGYGFSIRKQLKK